MPRPTACLPVLFLLLLAAGSGAVAAAAPTVAFGAGGLTGSGFSPGGQVVWYGTARIVEDWGSGSDNFAKDPPNATVSGFKKDGAAVFDVVVVLKSPKLEGNKLTFTTEVVHGVSFDFTGAIDRGEGKNPGDEAYFVLKGSLTENVSDVNKKVTSHSREVVFKRFPQDAAPAPASRK